MALRFPFHRGFSSPRCWLLCAGCRALGWGGTVPPGGPGPTMVWLRRLRGGSVATRECPPSPMGLAGSVLPCRIARAGRQR